jgi:hypothetical protein
MDDSPRSPERDRSHLRLVAEPTIEPGAPASARPRTIGRVIAQTALIADSAMTRRRLSDDAPGAGRSVAGRFLGRFR